MTDYDKDGGGKLPRKSGNAYDVGYGKPLREHQFRKGGSGNPSGRPKKQKSTVELLDLELSRCYPVLENGKKVKRSLRRVIVRNGVKKMVSGN